MVLQQVDQMAKHLKKANAENLEWLQELHENQQNTANALSVAMRLLVYLATQVLQTDVNGLKSLLRTLTEEELIDFLDTFSESDEGDEEGN